MSRFRSIFLTLILFVLPALACNFSAAAPPTTSDAQQQMNNAAATAQALAQQGAEQVVSTLESAVGTLPDANSVAATAQAAIGQPDTSADSLTILREKIAAIQPDANGQISITITDAELTQAIRAGQQAAATQGHAISLQEPQVVFTGGYIILTGNVTDPIAAQMRVVFSPYVDGVLQFEVVEASLGTIRIPPGVLQTAEGTLNNTLTEALGGLPANFSLQAVTMGEGTMTLVGQRN